MIGLNRSVSVGLLLVVVVCSMMSGCCCRPRPEKPEVAPPAVAPTPKPKPAEPTPGRIDEGAVVVPDPNLKPIYFDFDKYVIRPADAEILKSNAAWIKENMGKGVFKQILVEGHCDERGTNKYNMVLGERRANAAKNFLINEGIPADILVAVSYGEEKPADPRSNEEAWAKNRRSEFKKVLRDLNMDDLDLPNIQ
ncbi:MAG TPA: OmpA family protein [bacterium]|nr:OmpA family protein [bacterium]